MRSLWPALAPAFFSVALVLSAQAIDDFGPLPAFALTDQDGQAFTNEDLLGHLTVAGFIFTRCQGQCPVISGRMAVLQDRFAGEPGIHLLSITVDPEHDTPEVLQAYARRLGAEPERWRFATGERDAIYSLAEEGFMLGVEEGGDAIEPIMHSARLVLIDAGGHVRGTYPALEEDALRALERDARGLLKGPRGVGRGAGQ